MSTSFRFHKVNELYGNRYRLNNKRSYRTALYPHAQCTDKNIVKHGIENTPDNAHKHTYLRLSVRADKHSQYRAHNHKRICKQHYLIVSVKIHGQFSVGSQYRQYRCKQYKYDNRCGNTINCRCYHSLRKHFRCFFTVLFPQKSAGYDRPTHADAQAYSKKEIQNRQA